MWKHILMLMVLATSVSAQAIYQPQLKISLGEFFGECDEAKVSKVEIVPILECFGNAFNPSIPNPMMVVSSLRDERGKAKINAISQAIYKPDGTLNLDIDTFLSRLLGTIVNTPLVLISIIIETLFDVVKFTAIFIVRFFFVYMFYISLAFQTILRYFDQNQKLDSIQKIQASIMFMAASTIFMLAYGGAWLK